MPCHEICLNKTSHEHDNMGASNNDSSSTSTELCTFSLSSINNESNASIYADVMDPSRPPSRGIRRQDSIERSHIDLSLKLAELRTRSDETRLSLTETTTEKKALEESLSLVTQERNELKTTIQDLEASLTNITQEQSKTFAESMESLQQELRECTKDRTEMRLQVEQVQAERDRYKLRYRSALEENDRVQKERDDLRSEVSQLRTMVENMAREIEDTRRTTPFPGVNKQEQNCGGGGGSRKEPFQMLRRTMSKLKVEAPTFESNAAADANREHKQPSSPPHNGRRKSKSRSLRASFKLVCNDEAKDNLKGWFNQSVNNLGKELRPEEYIEMDDYGKAKILQPDAQLFCNQEYGDGGDVKYVLKTDPDTSNKLDPAHTDIEETNSAASPTDASAQEPRQAEGNEHDVSNNDMEPEIFAGQLKEMEEDNTDTHTKRRMRKRRSFGSMSFDSLAIAKGLFGFEESMENLDYDDDDDGDDDDDDDDDDDEINGAQEVAIADTHEPVARDRRPRRQRSQKRFGIGGPQDTAEQDMDNGPCWDSLRQHTWNTQPNSDAVIRRSSNGGA